TRETERTGRAAPSKPKHTTPTADRFGAAGPAPSFRARPARQRPPDTKQDSTHSNRTRPTPPHRDASSSQQLPTLDRHSDGPHQEPKQPNARGKQDGPPSARALPRRGAGAREVGGCGRGGEGGSALAPPRPVTTRVARRRPTGQGKKRPWPA